MCVKVGKSRSGGKEENRDAYNSLVEEYREYKRNYSRAFRFLASAVNTSIGLFKAYLSLGLIHLLTGQELNDSTLQLVQIFFDTASFDEIERDTEVKFFFNVTFISRYNILFQLRSRLKIKSVSSEAPWDFSQDSQSSVALK